MHRIRGIAGGMHNDVNGGIFVGRRPGAAQPNVPIGIHRQRGDQIIAVGIIDQSFLQDDAVLCPDFIPIDPAARVGGTLDPVAGEETATVLINALSSPGLTGLQLLAGSGLHREVPVRHGVGGAVRVGQRNRLYF